MVMMCGKFCECCGVGVCGIIVSGKDVYAR